jgi:hypothetical protein
MCLSCSNISANITTTIFEANEVEGGRGLIHSLAMEVRVGVWLSNWRGAAQCTIQLLSPLQDLWIRLQPPSTSFTLMMVTTTFAKKLELQHTMQLTPESQNYTWMGYNIVLDDVFSIFILN